MSVVAEGQVAEVVAPVVKQMSLSEFYPSLDEDGFGDTVEAQTEVPTTEAKTEADAEASWWNDDTTATTTVEETTQVAPQIQPVLTQIGEKLGFGDTQFESVDAIVEAINIRLSAEQQVPVSDRLAILNDVIALPNEDLIFHEFKQYGEENPLMALSDSEIEEKIESLRDSERLDTIAEQYRNKRKAEKANVEGQRAKEVEAKNNEMMEYRKSIEKAIPEFKPEENVQLSAKQVAELKRFILSGEFGNLLASNPSAIAKAAFDLHEMGRQYEKVKTNRLLSKGKSEVYKSLESGEPKVGATDSTNNNKQTVVRKTLSEYYGL